MPNKVNPFSGPSDNEQSGLSTNRGNNVVKTALRRFIPKRSIRNAIATSEIDTVDVIAATSRSTKNSDDHKGE